MECNVAIASSHFLAAYGLVAVSWSPWLVVAGVCAYLLRAVLLASIRHRMFAHKAMQPRNTIVRVFLAVLACTTPQGGIVRWAALHRAVHDAAANVKAAPRSAKGPTRDVSLPDDTAWSWPAWNNGRVACVADLWQHADLRALEPVSIVPWSVLCACTYLYCGLPGLVAFVAIPDVIMAHLANPVTTAVGQHRGTCRYRVPCMSSNNGWSLLLLAGDCWHNNHLADPSSAFPASSSAWWELDPAGTLIRLLHRLRLVHSVVPADEKTRASKLMTFPHSAVYDGWVSHARHTPVSHSFTYSLFLMATDISSADAAYAYDEYFLWSSRPRSRRSLPVAGHLPLDEYLDAEAVRSKVRDAIGVDASGGAVILVTHWRYLFLRFNPISLYFVYNRAGKFVAMVSEVHNTPWNEKCWYVERAERADLTSDEDTAKFGHFDVHQKKMHVSPFFELRYRYVFNFSAPGDTFRITMRLVDKDDTADQPLVVAMVLQRKAVSQAELTATLRRHPAMTWRVVQGIYWQAWQLLRKGVPFIDKAEKIDPGTDDKSRALRPSDFAGIAHDKKRVVLEKQPDHPFWQRWFLQSDHQHLRHRVVSKACPGTGASSCPF